MMVQKKKSEVENAGEIWMAFAALSFYLGVVFFVVCKWILGFQLPNLFWISVFVGLSLGYLGARLPLVRDTVNGLTDLFRHFT